MLLITGRSDNTVPPGNWDDSAYTTASNDQDRFYHTGATAIVKRWAQADSCSTARNDQSFNTGYADLDCGAPGRAWPKVLDCRAPMGHDYDLSWSWLVMDFFHGDGLAFLRHYDQRHRRTQARACPGAGGSFGASAITGLGI